MPSLAQILDQYFDVAFAAPDGVKKLRELILSLAMQGKLVPQDPSDQPARELLKEIEAEKSRLVKVGKIKPSKPLPEIKPDEVPYDLPKSWEWVRIRSMCHDWGQKTPDSLFTYIDVGSIDNKRGIISNDVQLLESVDAPSRARKIVCKGTVIYSTVRPYLLNIAIVDKDFSPEAIASTAFAILHPFCKVSNRFIYYYLRSPAFISYVESTMKGVAYPAINDGDFFQGLFPLPPIAEQRRIVAKIDELMARCAELEKLRQVHAQKQITIHNAALNQLLTAKDHNDFKTSWHFITQHFGELYSVKANVTELRKAILQLAVMGKLVPQDPNNQPASELLIAIALEKNRLVKEGRIKKPKLLPVIKDKEIFFDLPHSWEWVRLGDITSKITDGDHQTPPRILEGYRLLSAKNVRNGYLDFDNCDFISEENYLKSRERCCPEFNDLLIVSVGGTIGRTSLIPEDSFFALVRSVALIKPLLINSAYLKYSMDSSLLQDSIHTRKRGGAQPCLYLSEIEMFPFSLPPFAEQHRIVTKIDQLMTLCDKLEKQIDSANRKQTNLLNSVMTKN
jgi:type I restriction enzyme, S subunit